MFNQSDHLGEIRSFEYGSFGRRTLKEAGRPDGSLDRTVFTWDGDVLLMEERFYLPPRQPGEREPLTFRPVQIVREDPDDADALPVAQRMHTLSERHQWQGASLYLHEPGTFVPLARLDETLVEAAFIATGTDGRFVQVPAKTRHATLFYQNDHLGTPQELLDESGKVVWLGRYRAWGAEKTVWQAQPERHEAGNPIRFQGQYHDDETGLHYNRHRYYDPSCGRFISKDPIGLAGGINVFQYAPNPVSWIDPLGLMGYRVATRTVQRVELGRDLTDKQAISRVQRGGDVHAENRSDAISLGKRCACGKLMKHDAHPDRVTGSTEGRLPHVHPNNHEGVAGDVHIFDPKK
ncbi:RHS repeat-associated core domain-containing protein [Burkholderia ubonensis]|uniref:RHS repeat-associated core domain-containing protein n=1 Tax=Burkholderia ubonensis TaxID=101571 RepID=UPI0022B769EA|nr:RHS repeat-associated core domain-containing protein [Burkholderia ubonensis]